LSWSAADERRKAESVTNKNFSLEGRAAVVTGGSTGLGYAMARALMNSGARVLIAARREPLLKEAAEQLRSETTAGEVRYRTVDLVDRVATLEFAGRAVAELGGVDIFVGNAGQDLLEPVDAISEAGLDTLLALNLTSNILLTREFLPGMRARGWGRILFSSSTTSLVSGSTEGMSVYAATKAGLNAFTRTAAAETGHDGITVNALAFGVYATRLFLDNLERIDTELGDGASEAMTAMIASMTAVGRLGRPGEIDGIVQLLASDAGSYITGQTIPVDGGLSTALWPTRAA
jgi:gluconate 5-dehydrogenase